MAENPTKRTHRYKPPHHTNRFAWASTLLLEARSDPLTGLRFPPPSLSLSSPWSCHCTCTWLVPRMICRTAPASCVSVSHQCVFSSYVLHVRARGKKKCSVSRQYAVFGEEREREGRTGWPGLALSLSPSFSLSLCLCLCVSEASQKKRVDLDQRRLASSIGSAGGV